MFQTNFTSTVYLVGQYLRRVATSTTLIVLDFCPSLSRTKTALGVQIVSRDFKGGTPPLLKRLLGEASATPLALSAKVDERMNGWLNG